ncbi:DUF4269 domain-containing protein [uncultured Flavobacterium sp.]|uniref:DUF4269 domain-containing protein n=1 Tax=uncultured Flavobacterium sp. TaxID=165435 RepID=UPI0025DCB757|nr:DUF4269 domain-containing protein [uncultured Flavobacterium sp.]
MTPLFDTIDYLQYGGPVQQRAYQVLNSYRIIEALNGFSPILVGTIPLNINIQGSDLDILCCFKNKGEFVMAVQNVFSHLEKYTIREKEIKGITTIIANFFIDGFAVEIFGQSVPVMEQHGYRHMVIEHKILQEKGEAFRLEIICLKESGLKTEPAFAQMLGLKGDPYIALLEYEK